MKLRLFALRDASTRKQVPDLFFHSKPEAKKARDARNKSGENLAVTPGPDHHRTTQRHATA